MTDVSKAKPSIRVYAAGGFATNLISKFIGTNNKPGYANIAPAVIDTSLSNISSDLRNKLTEEDVFIVPNKDGAGKVRAMTLPEAQKHGKQLLIKFQPTELNVVIFSASGGTGSVFGPMLVKELLANKHPTIALVVGSEESNITLNNTVATFKTLENISKMVEQPITLAYVQNSETRTRKNNDQELETYLTALRLLASKENLELDTTDVANFALVKPVTQTQQGLVLLYVTTNEEAIKDLEYPLTMASLLSENGKQISTITPEYACVGYPSHADVLDGVDLHFVTSSERLPTVYDTLLKKQADLAKRQAARPTQQTLLSDTDEVDESGFVL